MNYWTQLSIDYANQKSYLDDLFQVYPTIPEGIREINKDIWTKIESSFKKKNNDTLIKELLNLNLFPIKDSYIAYLKRDKTSIERNPKTINRICGDGFMKWDWQKSWSVVVSRKKPTDKLDLFSNGGLIINRWDYNPFHLTTSQKIKKTQYSTAATNN